MRIAMGADHAGFEYKDRIAEMLRRLGYEKDLERGEVTGAQTPKDLL
jgi:ribose 5-phosphate isomerase RpiB